MDAARRDDFLRRSLASCHRLQSLLADVSAITRLEDGNTAIARADIDLADIILEVVADSKEAAAQKGLDITYSCKGPAIVKGNEALLISVMHNLIDNAIAYSGGTIINISLECSGTNAILTVADNGVGVSDEHLPRLFERFYRVDKGRSRQAGGTGLGLAIVKNAILWHGGTVAVSHNHPSGLMFTITIPLKR